MNPLVMRRIVAKGIIGVSLCTGAWFFFVEPMERRLIAIHDEEAAVRIAESSRPLPGAAELRTTLDRASAVGARSVRAADELQLYADLLESAAQAGLVVDQLVKRSVKPPAAKSPADTTVVPSRCLGFEMNVQGSFDALFDFITRLESPDSFSRIERLTLAPAGDSSAPLISATIDTIHWSFSPASTITAIEAGLAAAQGAETSP